MKPPNDEDAAPGLRVVAPRAADSKPDQDDLENGSNCRPVVAISPMTPLPLQNDLKDADIHPHESVSHRRSSFSLLEVHEPLLATSPGPPNCQPYEASAPATVAPVQALAADDVRAGMLWYMCSSFFFAGMGVCSKFLGDWGYPVFEITLVRSIIIGSISLSTLSYSGDSPWGNRKGLLLVRGTLGYASVTCFFTACTLLPIADATTFTFLAPLIVAFLSPLVLQERLSAATIATIPLCICGVLMITQPTFLFGAFGRSGAQVSALGVCIGLAQPFFSATAKMAVRVLRTTEKTNVVVLHLMLCTFVYSMIGCMLTWRSLVVPSTPAAAAVLVLQGLFGYGNQICITNGLARAAAASVMCMQYLSIVFSQLAGMCLFGEFSSAWEDVGMLVIVGGMCVYMWSEASRKSPARSRA